MKVIAANVAEFYAPLTGRLPERARGYWKSAANRVAGGAFYWEGDDKLVVLPAPLDRALVDQLAERVGYRNISVESTAGEAETLCAELAADSGFLDRLNGMGRGSLEISAWGHTPGLDSLLKRLSAEFPALEANNPEAGLAWLSRLADSKAGFRHFAAKTGCSSGSPLPRGFIAQNLSEAAALASLLLAKGISVVVKADSGVGGMGLLAYEEGHRPKTSLSRHLALAARSMPELKLGPLVVEEMVGKTKRQAHSCSAQFLLDGKGGGKFLFAASHLKASAGNHSHPFRFRGAALGKGALSPNTAKGLETAGHKVSGALSHCGLKGVIGIDFALDADGGLHLLEVNARRTTTTMAADLGAWLGKGGWQEKLHVTSLEHPPIQCAGLSELPREAREVLYPCAAAGPLPCGWLPVPVPCGGLSGAGAFSGALIIANSSEEAESIAEKLNRPLSRES